MNTISVNKMSLVDELGRERIFNGINMVHKGGKDGAVHKDYKPDWTEETFASFKKLGINIVRLGLIWDAIEPECGKYDDDYLDMMISYAEMCEKYGIYYYLDMHQDLYSAYYADGAPGWATITDSYKYKEPKFIWAEGYFFSKAVHRACDNFWNNTPVNGRGLQDRYCDMWKHVVEKFKDRPGLIGFDVMNEPYPGTDGGKAFRQIVKGGIGTIFFSGKVKRIKAIRNIIKGEDKFTSALAVLDDRNVMKSVTKPAESIIRQFDVKKYYPFFQKCAAAIREVTDKGIIIMENCYYSNLGIPCTTPRLVYKNGGREENLMFAPHAYDLTVDTPMTNTASNARVDGIFDQHRHTQLRLGVPVIVGEWGGMVDGSEEYPHLEHLLEKFDANKWSQTYWAYYPGLMDTKIMKIIARPYPQAVSGEIKSYGFDRKNKIFTLKYTHSGLNKGKTEIYLPEDPAKIEADGKYEVKTDDRGVITLCVEPVDGENTVKVFY